jgi:hypothetical protein
MRAAANVVTQQQSMLRTCSLVGMRPAPRVQGLATTATAVQAEDTGVMYVLQGNYPCHNMTGLQVADGALRLQGER